MQAAAIFGMPARENMVAEDVRDFRPANVRMEARSLAAMHSRSNPVRNLRDIWRAVLVVCTIAGFLGIQIASATHPHDEGSDHRHCCPVCHAGHTPVLQPAAEMRVRPFTTAAWRPHF